MIKENNKDVCADLVEAENGHHFLTIKNSEGELPIFLAIKKGYWDIVQDIVYETQSLDVKDDNDKLPISYMFDKLNARVQDKIKDKTKSEIVIFVKVLYFCF